MKLIVILFLACLCFFTGCYNDIEEELYPYTSGTCDLSAVNYSTTIVGILQNYGCLGCHSGPAPSGNINLDTYAGLKVVVDNGKLYGSITHSSGYTPMPNGGNKMSNCDINKVSTWIDGGAPEN